MRRPHANPRSRRALLSTLGASAAALAGCSGTTGTGSDYPVVRRTVGEAYEARSGLSVTVTNPRLRPAVVLDGHTLPVGMVPGGQYVVVDVATEQPTETADRSPRHIGTEFRMVTDGTTTEGGSSALRAEFHPPETGRPVGVPVAVAPAETAAVAWVRGLPKSVLWSLPEEVTSSLDAAASFVVEEVDVTEEDDPEVTLTVRNTGDRDGTFYANVKGLGNGYSDENEVLEVRVPAGETVTRTEQTGIPVPVGGARIVVDWGIDEVSIPVQPD